jgi:hypothetical protein
MRVWLVILDSSLGANDRLHAAKQACGISTWVGSCLGANSCQKRSEPVRAPNTGPYPSLLIYLELWSLDIKVLFR